MHLELTNCQVEFTKFLKSGGKNESLPDRRLVAGGWQVLSRGALCHRPACVPPWQEAAVRASCWWVACPASSVLSSHG